MDEAIIACLGCLVALAIWAVLGLAAAWVLMWAWNLLVPALFHGPTITYTMACAVYFALSLIGGAFKMTITTPSSS